MCRTPFGPLCVFLGGEVLSCVVLHEPVCKSVQWARPAAAAAAARQRQRENALMQCVISSLDRQLLSWREYQYLLFRTQILFLKDYRDSQPETTVGSV